MSDDAKNAIAYGIAGLFIVAAIILGGWFGAKVIRATWGWAKDVVNVERPTQEERATADAAWAKDPRNPRVAGQKCLDAGGYPTYSSWDGRFRECKGPNNKNVNIEVNQ